MRVARICLAALALAFGAHATILQARVDLESLTRGADAVVRARVLRQVSHFGAQGPSGGLIFTTTELAPIEWWKGTPEAGDVLVRAPGGAVGELSQEVEGVARFREGDEVVVFLKRRAGAGDRARARTQTQTQTQTRLASPDPLDTLPDLAVYEVHQWAMGMFALGQATPGGRVRALRDRQALLCQHCGGEADDDLPLDDLRARVQAAARVEARP